MRELTTLVNKKSKIGNAYKTILARTSRSKSADSDVSLEDRGEAAKALASIGIEVYDQNGAYQDFSVTLDELSAKWDNLTDAQRANVSEALAGVRNINTMQQIIATWDEAKELAGMVEEDPNYYLEVQEKGMNSIQSNMDTLKATMQDFWYNFLNQDAINSGLQGLTSLAEVLSTITKTAKNIPAVGDTLSALTLGIGALGTSGLIDNIIKERQKLKKAEGVTGLFGGFSSGFKQTGKDLLGLGLNKGSDYTSIFAAINAGFNQAKASGDNFIKSTGKGFKTLWNNMSGVGKSVLGISAAFLAIEVATKTFDALTTTAEESKKAVSDANAEYETQTKTLKDNKESIDGIKNEWSTLSKGVDTATNENISLTNDEYQRYLELNNQIAEILPNTVSGIDAQGNAILNLAGDVQALNNEFSNLAQSQARTRFNENAASYFEEFDRLSGKDGFWDQVATSLGGGDISDTRGYQATMDLLDEISDYENVSTLKDHIYGDEGIEGLDSGSIKYLEDTLGINRDMTQEDWEAILGSGSLKAAMDEQKALFEEGASGVKTAMQDYLTMLTEGDGEYKNLEDSLISDVSKFIQTATTDQVSAFGKNKAYAMSQVSGWLEALKGNTEAQSALSNLTSLDENSSLNKILNAYKNDLKTLSEGLGLDENQLKEQFNLKDAEKMEDVYNDIIKSSDKFKKAQKDGNKEIKNGKELMEDFIDEQDINTLDELNSLKEIMAEANDMDDLERKFLIDNFDINSVDEKLSMLKENIESVENAFTLMNDAMSESNSARGLSVENAEAIADQFSSLKGFDYDRLFESTSSGNHLNGEYFEQLQKQFADTEIKKYTDEISDLQKEYQEYCLEIENATSAQEKNIAIQNRDNLSDRINKLKEYQSQIEGITNAVNLWQQAEARGDEGDLYDSVRSGLEDAKEMFNEGLIGDDGFQAFTQMFSDQDLSGLGSDEIAEVFQSKLPQMESWLADGRDGVNNFIKDVAKLNEGLIDASGNVDFDFMPDVETLAQQLGVSESLIDTMFKKLNQYGADIDFSEAADNLRSLRQQVVESGNELDEETKKKYTFDIDAGEGIESAEELTDVLEDQKKQIEDTMDTVDKGTKEYEYLEDQLDYVNARIGEIELPKIDFESPEGIEQLNNELEVLNEEADTEISIEWGNESPEYFEGQIEDVEEAIKSLQGEDGKINMETDGATEALDVLTALQQKAWSINNQSNISLRVDTSQLEGETQNAVNDLIELQTQAQIVNSLLQQQQLGFPVDTSTLEEAKQKLSELVSAYQTNHPEATADVKTTGVDLAQQDIATLASNLTTLDAQEVLVTIGVEDSQIKQYTGTEKTGKGKVIWDNETSRVDTYANSMKTASGTVTWGNNTTNVKTHFTASGTINWSGNANVVDGNAHVSGNANSNGNANKNRGIFAKGRAFAKGTWGAVKDSTSLVGELGR